MKVGELSCLLEGFAFSDHNMIKETKLSLFMFVKEKTTIVGAVIPSSGEGFSDMKDGTTSNSNTPWRLNRVELTSTHAMDASSTFPEE